MGHTQANSLYTYTVNDYRYYNNGVADNIVDSYVFVKGLMRRQKSHNVYE